MIGTRAVAVILVVDEEQDSARLIERLLEKKGHRVFSCNEHGDALDRVKSLVPELVVIGVRPPKSECLRLAALLKAAAPSAKVLALSPSAIAETAGCSAVDDYLVRPVELAVIERKIHELLGLENQEDEQAIPAPARS